MNPQNLKDELIRCLKDFKRPNSTYVQSIACEMQGREDVRRRHVLRAQGEIGEGQPQLFEVGM